MSQNAAQALFDRDRDPTRHARRLGEIMAAAGYGFHNPSFCESDLDQASTLFLVALGTSMAWERPFAHTR